MRLSACCAFAAAAEVAQSTLTFDAGGGRTVKEGLISDSSVGGIIEVFSPETGSARINKAGLLGQVYDIIRLEPPLTPVVVPPGESNRLGGVAHTDDGTILRLSGGELLWMDHSGFLHVEITAEGYASSTNIILTNTLAVVSGFYQGVTGEFQLLFVPSYAPTFRIGPELQAINAGSSVSFSAVVDGFPPLDFQWYWNNIAIDQATEPTLTLRNVQPRDQGTFTVRVTNVFGSASWLTTLTVTNATVPARIAKLEATPAESPTPITDFDIPILVATNSSVRLEVRVDDNSSLPVLYQWTLNGENLTDRAPPPMSRELNDRGALSGATSNVLTISDLTLADAGTYSVKVQNSFGVTNSAEVRLAFPGMPPLADNKATNGALVGSLESESIDFKWRSPAYGTATFTTAGSGFDTILRIKPEEGAHENNSFEDDESGGFHTSFLRFNAASNTNYIVTVSGAAGALGDVLVQWQLQRFDRTLPEIISPPQSQTVILTDGSFPDTNVVFTAVVRGPVGSRYSWRREDREDGRDLPRNVEFNDVHVASLTLPKVGLEDIGIYRLIVDGPPGLENPVPSAISEPVSLEAGTIPGLKAVDRFGDIKAQTLAGDPARPFVRIPVLENEIRLLSQTRSRVARSSVAVGISGTHYFSNSSLTVDASEPKTIDNIPYATAWFELQADAQAAITLTTEGSEPDTDITVRQGDNLVVYNNDSSSGLKWAQVTFEMAKGVPYKVNIAAPDDAIGIVKFSWKGIITNFAWIPIQDPKEGFLRISHGNNEIVRVATVQHWPTTNSYATSVVAFYDVGGTNTIVPTVQDYSYWIGVQTLPLRPPGLEFSVEHVWCSDPLSAKLVQQEDGVKVLLRWSGSGLTLFEAASLTTNWTRFEGVRLIPTGAANYEVLIPISTYDNHYFKLE